MKIYNSIFGGKEDITNPQYEVKGNKVYATIYNKAAPVKNRILPMYEIKGDNIHRTAFHPEGHSIAPVYKIAGNNIHSTIHNSNHIVMPTFHIKR